jgi:nitrogen fixation protein FixH
MKFNWGTGIALTYTTFALAMIFAVYRSTQYDNSLVSDHYYADDLAYQKQYDKITNANALKQDLKIANDQVTGKVELIFPENLGRVAGKIQFFCPSNSSLDFSLPLQLGANFHQIVSSAQLKKGLWKIKVDWSAGGRVFYKEERLTI